MANLTESFMGIRLLNPILPIITAFMVLLGSAGCRDERPRYMIGVSQCSDDSFRVRTNEDMKREAMLHDEIGLEIRSGDNSNRKQIEDIHHFIENDFDLIIVSPNDADSITEAISEAFRKGIPVVTFDRAINGDDFTAHMEVDNYQLGAGAAQYARSVMREPIQAIEIEGPFSASPAQRRHEGFTAKMKEYPDANILSSVCGNWDDVHSEIVTDSLLKLYPMTNLIFAHTDHMATGAARAVRKAGRDDIIIIGIDGFPEVGLKAVSEGVTTATLLYSTEGERLIRIASDILDGKPYQRMNLVAPLSPVDKSNVDILLAQYDLLSSETAKINLLRDNLNQTLERVTTQKILLILAVVAVLSLGLSLFLVLKTVNNNRRYQRNLLDKNKLLEEEKRKQEELYRQLQDATRSKLTFFTNVSHDLRTPLTLIAGPVDEVASAEYLTPSHKAMMRVAKKNTAILRRLIDQILDFRKYETGKATLNLSSCNLRDKIEDWAENFKEIAHKRDIRLKLDLKNDSSGEVAIDVNKIERVFFNLLGNAFKHTPDNGEITVAYHSNENSVSFSIKDTGRGIPANEIERIFDQFYQVESAHPEGSGIGLAVSKAFVDMHGGSIKVESKERMGTTFTVTLPIRSNASASSQTSVNMEADESKPDDVRITEDNLEADIDTTGFKEGLPLLLVIDDNPDIRLFIQELLGKDYNVITATDGRQGVKKASRFVPDLIICDVMMPEMDGLECLKILKSELSTSHIPVLMLTACSLEEQRLQGYERGADAYLAKPFDGDMLVARCRNLLENRRRIAEKLRRNPKSSYDNETAPEAIPDYAPNDVENDFYTEFIKIITSRISDPELSVEYIAEAVCLSQSQLTRKIKALTNYTPVEIIRTMRLKRARKSITGSDKRINEIAFENGFTSLGYFSKCYKEMFGETPSETRGRGS